MKFKQKFATVIVVLAIVLFGVVSVKHTVDDPPLQPQNAAFYCAPYVNYWCWVRYSQCGPYQWNRWLNEWIDRCGGVLF